MRARPALSCAGTGCSAHAAMQLAGCLFPSCFGWQGRLRNPMSLGRLHFEVGWSITWRSSSKTQRPVPLIQSPPQLSTSRADWLSACAWRCLLLCSNVSLTRRVALSAARSSSTVKHALPPRALHVAASSAARAGTGCALGAPATCTPTLAYVRLDYAPGGKATLSTFTARSKRVLQVHV